MFIWVVKTFSREKFELVDYLLDLCFRSYVSCRRPHCYQRGCIRSAGFGARKKWSVAECLRDRARHCPTNQNYIKKRTLQIY